MSISAIILTADYNVCTCACMLWVLTSTLGPPAVMCRSWSGTAGTMDHWPACNSPAAPYHGPGLQKVLEPQFHHHDISRHTSTQITLKKPQFLLRLMLGRILHTEKHALEPGPSQNEALECTSSCTQAFIGDGISKLAPCAIC